MEANYSLPCSQNHAPIRNHMKPLKMIISYLLNIYLIFFLLPLGLRSGSLLVGFPIKILCTFLFSLHTCHMLKLFTFVHSCRGCKSDIKNVDVSW